MERCWFGVGCGVGEPVEVAEDAADRPWLLLLFFEELEVGGLYYSYVERVMNGFNRSAIFGCYGI